MVGVPGKYKGCETCRRRRVKCDNTKPLCRKCLDNGRDCEGYQRERVFITAGVKDGGRCSSHPPRRAGSSSKSQSPEEPQRFVLDPVSGSSAWDRAIRLSSRGAQHVAPVVAVHVDLGSMVRVDAGGGRSVIEHAVYSMPDFRVPFGRDFDVAGQCLVHISVQDAGRNLCAFVYEHRSPPLPSEDMLPWGTGPEKPGIRGQGPRAFQAFPGHHFFARIYRPHAIGQALLNRRPTFLASPEWSTTPWATHPKTPLDNLLDTLSHLPDLLSRTDILLSMPPTPALQDLHATAQHLSARLDAWHAALMPPHWPDDRDAPQIPFGGALAFRDGPSALACIYYWTALLLLRPCMVALRRALAPQYGVGGDGRARLAGDVCRALDFALARTAQPDLLVVPLLVVEGFFGGAGLEVVWCAGFRERLAVRGEFLAGLLRGRKWAELGRF